MKFILLFLLLQLLPNNPPKIYLEPNHYILQDIKVKDGDTIVADIYMGFNIILDNETIRMSDYDACEASKIRDSVFISDEEVKKGKEAKKYLEEIVNTSQYILLTPNSHKFVDWMSPVKQRDQYGRILGFITIYKQEDLGGGHYMTQVIKLADLMKQKQFLRVQLSSKELGFETHKIENIPIVPFKDQKDLENKLK